MPTNLTLNQIVDLTAEAAKTIHDHFVRATGEPMAFVLIVGEPSEPEKMAHVHNHHCPGCLMNALELTAAVTLSGSPPDRVTDAATGEIVAENGNDITKH